jgi:hypothetical protein
MARIRTIKPEFWSDEKVVECSLNARLLFIGLWNFSDDAGRIEDSPRQIKMKVYPGDDFTAAEIDGMLRELSENGLILRYIVENKQYIQIKGWRHQVISKPQASKLPGPVEGHSRNAPGKPHDGMEWKGKEGKERIPLSSPQPEPEAASPDEPPVDGLDDRPWDETLSPHDRALVLVWRATGSSEDQIRSWLVSTKGPHRDRIAGWMRDGISAERLPGIVTAILDRCEGSDGELRDGDGKPIRDVWAYLGKAVPAEWRQQQASDAAEDKAAGDWVPSNPNSPEQWENRRRTIARGIWLTTWPRPEDRETPEWARELFAQAKGKAA